MKRWLDGDVPPELRRALRSADEDARPAALAKLERRVTRSLGTAAGAGLVLHTNPAAAQSVAPAAASSGWLASAGLGAKIVIGVAAVGAAGAIALRVASHDRAASREGAVAVPVEVVAPVEVVPITPAAEAALDDRGEAATAVPAERKVGREQPRSERARAAREPASQLSDEVRQLDAIRKHLRTDTARALAAADAHERRFPNGALREERELLRIEALFRLDRDREARARAAALTASSAGRAYQVQVQRLIARYTGGTLPDVNR